MIYKLLKPQLFISQTVQLNNSKITRKLRQNRVNLSLFFPNTLRKSNSNRVNVALPYSSTACG